MALLRWIAGFVIASALIAFALLNRQDITLTFSPLHPPVDIPLYAIIFCAVFTGFLIGAGTVWFGAAPLRRERRRQRKQIRALEETLKDTAAIKPDAAPAREFFPALPQNHIKLDAS